MIHDKTVEETVEYLLERLDDPYNWNRAEWPVISEKIQTIRTHIDKLREVVTKQAQLEVKYKTEMAVAREEKRVLREALEAALQGHTWYEETFPEQFNECDFEWRKQAEEALEKTKGGKQ